MEDFYTNEKEKKCFRIAIDFVVNHILHRALEKIHLAFEKAKLSPTEDRMVGVDLMIYEREVRNSDAIIGDLEDYYTYVCVDPKTLECEFRFYPSVNEPNLVCFFLGEFMVDVCDKLKGILVGCNTVSEFHSDKRRCSKIMASWTLPPPVQT